MVTVTGWGVVPIYNPNNQGLPLFHFCPVCPVRPSLLQAGCRGTCQSTMTGHVVNLNNVKRSQSFPLAEYPVHLVCCFATIDLPCMPFCRYFNECSANVPPLSLDFLASIPYLLKTTNLIHQHYHMALLNKTHLYITKI